jgi:hypothetical protein
MTISAASYDYIDLQNEVTDLIKPLASIPDYSSLNTGLTHYINRGYVDFVRRTGGIEDRVDITTVANQESYTFADAANLQFALKIIQVRWDENTDAYADSDWEGERLKPYPGGYTNLPKTRVYGKPFAYWYRQVGKRDGLEMGTWNIIDAVGRLRVWLTRMPLTLLSANEDEPEVQIGFQEALVNYAVWKMYKIYEHRNKDWKAKALEHRSLYFELVNDYKQTFAYDSYDESLIIQDEYVDDEV